MRPVRYLPSLQRSAVTRLVFLWTTLDPGARVDRRELDRRVAYATVETANVWDSYCRAFYLSCALGTHDRTGSLIVGVTRFRGESDAIGNAIAIAKPHPRKSTGPWDPRDEPDWHQVRVFLKIMRDLAPPNLPQIQSAVSVSTFAFTYLQPFRNFFVHRSKSSASSARQAAPHLNLSPKLHPTEILASYTSSTSDTVLREWLVDLRNVVELMG